MRILRILFAIVIIFTLLAVPVMAAEGKEKEWKIGDKKPFKTGEEQTYLGESPDGQEMWRVVFGEPEYLPGTDTPYDSQWHLIDGVYVAGDNVFDATVDDKRVRLEYQGKQSNWKPDITIGNEKREAGIATLLPVDPINENYPNNTLMWDYGNGVKGYLRIIEGMLIEYYIIDYPQTGEIVIDNKVSKDRDFVWHRPASVWDAENKPINLIETINHKIIISQTDLEGAVYPITIDPDATFTTTSSDGIAHYDSLVWATARGSASAELVSSVVLQNSIFTYMSAGSNYVIERDYLYFDTSAIPDASVIADAVLNGYVDSLTDDDNGKVYIVEGMDTYPHDPLVLGDYDFNQYTFGTEYGYADFGTDLTVGQFNVLNKENPNGLKTIVNKTGYTKLCLIERRDKANEVPLILELNLVMFFSFEKGEGFRPTLEIDYGALAPSITTDAASNIAKTSARLNATVDDDGGEDTQVRWGYGTTTQAVFANYDTNTAWSAAEWSTGEHPFEDIAGLNANDQYFYRAQIKNSHSEVDSTEVNFMTLVGIDEPTDFRGYPSTTVIDLSWVKGEGSSKTLVRYSDSTFPTAIGEGTQLYFDVGSSSELTGLDPGTTIWFSAWGESDGGYSAGYSTVAVTTNAFDVSEGDPMETPTAFTWWNQEPDYTRLSNLEPIYSSVNGVADSFGTPRNTVWMLIALAIITITSLAILKMSGFFAAGVTSLMLMFLIAGMGLIPSWFIFIAVILYIAAWMSAKGALRG